MGSDMPTDGRWLLQALSVHWYVLDALHAGPRRLRGVWGMTRDSRLSLLLHPCIIADFLTDDDPLAQELNKYQRYRRHSMSQDQRGRDQVPISALPPVFTHIDIADHPQLYRTHSGRSGATLLDIEHLAMPMTAIERAQRYHSAARMLLEIVAAILEDRENRQ